jgi:hypothetical protein
VTSESQPADPERPEFDPQDFWRRAKRIAVKKGLPADKAEDAAQDACVKRLRADAKHVHDITAWENQIARRAVFDQWKSKQRVTQKEVPLQSAEGDPLTGVQDPPLPSDDDLAVRQAMRFVDERDVAVLDEWLKWRDKEISREQLADFLGGGENQGRRQGFACPQTVPSRHVRRVPADPEQRELPDLRRGRGPRAHR